MARDTQDTSSEILHAKLPCEDCGSSDAKFIYSDGWSHCFSCKKRRKVDGMTSEPEEVAEFKAGGTKKAAKLKTGEVKAIKGRSLTLETCRKFGVETIEEGKNKFLSFPYFNDKGQKIAQKLRGTDKSFSFVGEPKNPPLFGQQLWRSGKRIIITEGEIDAMSVSQVQGHKWAVVSVPTGAAGSKKAISNNIQWLEENFEEVVLMFDNDEAGRAAALECATLFSPNKCWIATLPLKDANECLHEGKTEDIIQAIWNAKPYRPDGIVTVGDMIPRIGLKAEMGRPLPWPSLTALTFGLKSPALWIWTSGSCMGKTELFKSMMAQLIKDGVKVGAILLEEEAQDTVVDMAGKLVGKCYNSPDIQFDIKERDDAIKQLQDSEALYLYDHFGHDDYDAIRAVIRHMVVGCGCEVIFLDHITAFTDGMGNEANALAERIMKELASMTRELKFNLQVISHVRKSDSSRKPAEEGGRVKIDDLKGSGAVKQWANIVIALERDQQSEDEDTSRTTTVRILKARGAGKNVGRTVAVKYFPETGELLEVEQAEVFGGFSDIKDNDDF